MKIGINASYLTKPATGIGVVTREFMRALSGLPIASQHEWIWYTDGGVPLGDDWPLHWRFHPVPVWWKRDDIPHRYWYERYALPQAVCADECDVFFSLYQSATRLPAHIRHVMFVHDLVPKHFPEYVRNWRQRLHQFAIDRAIPAAHHIIVPSQATATDLISFVGLAEDVITVAPLGVAATFRSRLSAEQKQKILAQYDLEPGYLYHGGGLEIRKNTTLILRAYAEKIQSLSAVPWPMLVISGTVYPESNPLATPARRLIQELGLTGRVRLLGRVPETDLQALYQSAAAFVFPSRAEGFGLPVLEAFASGVPVVTTAAGALAELAQGAAISIDPDDVAGLIYALDTVLSDRAQRDRLVVAGDERATRYTWPQFAEIIVTTLIQ